MSAEANRALVQRFFGEVFNQQNPITAREIIAQHFVAQHPAFPAGIRGPEGMLQMLAFLRGGFPDLHYVPEDVLVEGDRVAIRWTATGTHQGTFLALPATGRHVTITGIDIVSIADGLLVEAWVSSDYLGLLQQLGAIPSRP